MQSPLNFTLSCQTMNHADFPPSLQYFSNTISRLLLPVDGAHPSACEDMGSAVSVVEAAAHKGLLQCIDTVMSEVRSYLITGTLLGVCVLLV